MFKKIAILLLFFSVAKAQISFSLLPCKSKFDAQQRQAKIVGGAVADKHEMPFIVSLMRRGGHFCGASILSERWILTAGHCICNGLNQFMKPAQIQGAIGLHSINKYAQNAENVEDDIATVIDFKNIVPHPNYKCTDVKNDIALIELVQPIKFTQFIQPTCLTSDERDVRNFENELATVSGWGWTHENQANGIRADTLRKAAVKIWNNEICENSYKLNGKQNNFISDTQLCAGFENGGIDSCWADSGGPLITKDNNLIGVVSTGIGCGRPGLPGIYTRVSKYLKWIDKVVNNNE